MEFAILFKQRASFDRIKLHSCSEKSTLFKVNKYPPPGFWFCLATSYQSPHSFIYFPCYLVISGFLQEICCNEWEILESDKSSVVKMSEKMDIVLLCVGGMGKTMILCCSWQLYPEPQRHGFSLNKPSLLHTFIFILGTAYSQVDSLQCSRHDYDACVKMADPLLKDPHLIFPDNRADIDLVCR